VARVVCEQLIKSPPLNKGGYPNQKEEKNHQEKKE
jgi:hypothetical protein